MAEILRVTRGAYALLKSKAMIFDARGNGGGGITPTITGDHQNRVTDYTAIVLEIHESNFDRQMESDMSRRSDVDSPNIRGNRRR